MMKGIFNRANNSANNADYIDFGGNRIEIPKLTIAKWRLLFDRVETLPSILINIFSSRNSSNFSATLIAGLGLVLDEIVELVSVLTGREREWIEENVDHNELIEFITKTAEKNDFASAVKKFSAAFGKWVKNGAAMQEKSRSTSGS
ncbi:hypothetical protein [Cohnella yongneupensis]|uniref:Uncharacterized protein n=1 Tax=Cohnella yongneupensis TaxID=425006 RepID=A0ABW0QVZ9_9BACL